MAEFICIHEKRFSDNFVPFVSQVASVCSIQISHFPEISLYIYVCIYVCTYVCMYVCIYVCVRVCVYFHSRTFYLSTQI